MHCCMWPHPGGLYPSRTNLTDRGMIPLPPAVIARLNQEPSQQLQGSLAERI